METVICFCPFLKFTFVVTKKRAEWRFFKISLFVLHGRKVWNELYILGMNYSFKRGSKAAISPGRERECVCDYLCVLVRIPEVRVCADQCLNLAAPARCKWATAPTWSSVLCALITGPFTHQHTCHTVSISPEVPALDPSQSTYTHIHDHILFQNLTSCMAWQRPANTVSKPGVASRIPSDNQHKAAWHSTITANSEDMWCLTCSYEENEVELSYQHFPTLVQ